MRGNEVPDERRHEAPTVEQPAKVTAVASESDQAQAASVAGEIHRAMLRRDIKR
jgi:hypothetical protein